LLLYIVIMLVAKLTLLLAYLNIDLWPNY